MSRSHQDFSKSLLFLVILLLLQAPALAHVCSDYIKYFPNYTCKEEEQKGSGASGTGFLVEKDGQLFILKIQPTTQKSAMELATLSALAEEDFVVTLYEVQTDKKNTMAILEYGEQGNLLHVLKNSDYFTSFLNCVSFFRKLVQGVINIHKHGIVHADIKLENIVITDKFEPLIIDFDLSVKISEKKPIRGTRKYMAPEIIGSFGKSSNLVYDRAIDIYSLGVVFYAMVKEEFPISFQGFEYSQMLHHKIHFKANDKLFFMKMVKSMIALTASRISETNLIEELNQFVLKPSNDILQHESTYMLSDSIRQQIYTDESYTFNKEGNNLESLLSDLEENLNDGNQKIICVLLFLLVLFILVICLIIWLNYSTNKSVISNIAISTPTNKMNDNLTTDIET